MVVDIGFTIADAIAREVGRESERELRFGEEWVLRLVMIVKSNVVRF